MHVSQFDVSQFDLSQFDVSQLNVSQFDVSQFDVSQFDVSQFNVSQFNVSQFDASQFNVSQLNVRQFDVAQFSTEAEFRVPQFACTTLTLHYYLNIGGDHTSYIWNSLKIRSNDWKLFYNLSIFVYHQIYALELFIYIFTGIAIVSSYQYVNDRAMFAENLRTLVGAPHTEYHDG